MNPNVQMVADLGLTEYLANRLAIAGPVEMCEERLHDLKKLGVNQIWSPIRFADDDQAEQLRRFTADVLPAFRSYCVPQLGVAP